MNSLSKLRRGGRSRRNRALAILTIPLLAAPLLASAPPDEARANSSNTGNLAAPTPTNKSSLSAPLELSEPKTVTLITGDKVTVHPNGTVEPQAGPGREHISFDQQNLGNQILVVPSDAAQLLTEGKLDERLFDVTYLIQEGYDDSSRGDLPLIIEGKADKIRDVASTRGSKVERQSRNLKMSSVAQNKTKDKGRLWSRVTNDDAPAAALPSGVDKIWLDGMSHVTLDESVPQIGAPEVWESGFTGAGVTVAVLDTGVDSTHPDLRGQVVAEQVFSENPLSGAAWVDGLDDPVRYMSLRPTLEVPKEGSSDPLVHVGRACVDSEGDELLADPAGKTALIVRGLCTFAEKFDAAVEAGATGVLIYNNELGIFRGDAFASEHADAAWGATISDTVGAALLDLLGSGENVILEFDGEYPGDINGHGTHVASTVAGTGAASDGARRGVAPDASLLNGKVCDDFGGCEDSWVIAGMEWAAANGADVVNLSLAGRPTDGTDPLSQAVNTLTDQYGTLFVIAAGNNGPAAATISTPGAADAALTVGAVDLSDQIAEFSSRGPRVGDHAVKPEITAPGVHITAARASGTALCQDSCVQPGDGPADEYYTSASGTSMAAPHVAGAAALLAQAQPDLDGPALKDALTSTAADSGHLWFQQGAGRVDVARAVSQLVYANASVNFGQVARADGPVSQDVRYVNHSDRVATLRLDSSLNDILGNPVGKLQLSRSRVTIRPGDEKLITATIDPATLTTEGGLLGGVITATGSDVTVRSAVGFALQRDIVPLADDWPEEWTKAFELEDSSTIRTELKGAALGPDGKQLFMVGAQKFTTDGKLTVMAVDAATGETIWDAKQPVSYASAGPAPGIAVAPDGSKLFVTQDVFDPVRHQVDIVTMAFNNAPPIDSGDPELGERLWQARYEAVNLFKDFHPGGVERVAISPDGQTVIVVGTQREDLDGGKCEMLASCTTSMVTIAYNATSGEQSWVSRYKGPTNDPDRYDQAGDVVFSADGNLAFVSGIVAQDEDHSDAVTIAYVVDGERKGTERWVARNNIHLGIGPSRRSTLSEDGKRLFVTNAVTVSRAPFDERIEMQALDPRTGEQLWSSLFGAVDHGFLPGHTTLDRERKGGVAVSPKDDLVFVTGEHCEGGRCTGAHAQVTVAFDQQTGEERWFQIHESSGPAATRISSLTPRGVSAVASPDGERLYVTGACCWSPGRPETSDQVTMTYDAATGELLRTARHKFVDDYTNEGVHAFMSSDGGKIYSIALARAVGRPLPSFWGVATYDAPATLSANAHRTRGNWLVDLTWSAPGASEVDIKRDGELVGTVTNSGTWVDELGKARNGQVVEYQVCEAGSDNCSLPVDVVVGERSSPGHRPIGP